MNQQQGTTGGCRQRTTRRLRRSLAVIAGASLAWTACGPPAEPTLKAQTFEVTLKNLPTEPTAPLRFAVVWTRNNSASEQSFVTTVDQAIEPDQTRLSVRFEIPPADVITQLSPLEAMKVTGSAVGPWSIYRPRLIVYEDTVPNGRFDFSSTIFIDEALSHAPTEAGDAADASDGSGDDAAEGSVTRDAGRDARTDARTEAGSQLDSSSATPAHADASQAPTDAGGADSSADGGTAPPRDRIVAMDPESGQSLAYVRNVRQMVLDLSLNMARSYYEFSGGKLTPWVQTVSTNGIWLASKPKALVVTGNPSLYAARRLECLRQVTNDGTFAQRVQFYQPYQHITGWLDPAFVPDALCGLSAGECSNVLLESLTDPVASSSPPALLECRRTAASSSPHRETLAIFEPSFVCRWCGCASANDLKLYVADAEALPSWWPCGQEVDYCDSALPLTMPDPACH